MTLGPIDRADARCSSTRAAESRDWLTVFGRVPFFYYLLHIPLIHLLAIAISVVRTPGPPGGSSGTTRWDRLRRPTATRGASRCSTR